MFIPAKRIQNGGNFLFILFPKKLSTNNYISTRLINIYPNRAGLNNIVVIFLIPKLKLF